MITPEDFYTVMCAMVPLYVAMLLAYASVKWWKIFTPEQCSGINRFVAVFAVPVLSFHFISHNNPYQMDTRFILADTLSKLLVLLLLSLWACLSPSSPGRSRLDWLITLFSIATLPNTLVMGIPLLRAMYGDFTQSLMVQLVVLQCIIWYTLLLFLFEYRAATLLIQEQFPGPVAAAIAKIKVDGDVISLDGRDPIHAESEMDADGRVRLRIRRSVSSAPESGLSSSVGFTPARLSNISGAEIYSLNTPGRHPMEQFTIADVTFGYRSASPRLSGYASSDAYSLQPTPRESNFNEMEIGTPVWMRSPAAAAGGGRVARQQSPAVAKVVRGCHEGGSGGGEGQGDKDVGVEKEISFRSTSKFAVREDDEEMNGRENQEMPRAMVMLKLILTMVGRKLSRNPNTYSSILGLLWSLISFKWEVSLPSLVKNSIKIISDAGLGMAMFSLGLFMALQPRIIACGAKMAMLSLGIRFLSGPIIMSAASMAVGLKGVRLHTAIVQAALPQGIVPFVFAREYGLHPDILSTGVIFGMLVSLPITLLYYILLGL
ncbi:auxin efflux carrier component 6 [Elaeis guineensis]|uniref:Auxin efflux carrier component n=1 Tax=Elaeis guineensis var. tenera TaxID=51953 RepID=A0A6I9QP86_ELAGV|nr:auxin efflux carrier component 6 [Elaeis guineensis]